MTARTIPLLIIVLLTTACSAAAVQLTATPVPDPDLLAESYVLHLSPRLAMRYANRETASPEDDLIAAIQNGDIFPIAGLQFDISRGINLSSPIPPGAPIYVRIDSDSGDSITVAWYDAEADYVVDIATNYPLNVRSAPGTGTRKGPNGEQFYVYGFAWYESWQRIFPEPIIQLLDDFYTEGIEYMREGMWMFKDQIPPDTFLDDGFIITWDDSILQEMSNWRPDLDNPPYMTLPDSGKVDIRDSRFQEVLDDGMLLVGESSLDTYLSTRSWTRSEVVDTILNPFNHPEVFSDLHKAIILGAIYDGEGKLIVDIDPNLLKFGMMIPGTPEKDMLVASGALDIFLDFPGVYNPKFLHEMAHLEINPPYTSVVLSCEQGTTTRRETLIYLMEFMWWVQQYPGDAPVWEWEPLNSGPMLALLLNGVFYASDTC